MAETKEEGSHDRPMQAPGSNFTEPHRSDDVDDRTFEAVLDGAVGALEHKGVDHLVVGGIASATHGRPRWTHDVDLLVRPPDAPVALDALATAGFATDETHPDWLYKAEKDGVEVDVIFTCPGGVVLDDEMLARGREEEFHGRKLRVVSPEDLVVIKAVVHDEHMPRHWHDALGVLARSELDWEYLLRRAAIHGARRVLSLLMYAQADDLAVPNGPIRALFETVYRDWPETGPDRGEARPDRGEAGPDR